MAHDEHSELLLLALADQLKMPLLQINQLAETGLSQYLKDITNISRQTLRLVDAYAVASTQTELELEPLTTASVLYDVANAIDPVAKQHRYQVHIDIHGHNRPVMGHRQALKDMLVLLGTGFIQSGLEEQDSDRRLIIGTHPSRTGTVVGVFCSSVEISQEFIRMSRRLHGRAAQPLPAIGIGGGAALAVADRLSERMNSPLKSYRHSSLQGIGSLLSPSSQLQLV